MPSRKKLLLLPLVCLSLYAEEVQYNIDTLIEKALVSSPDLNVSRSSFEISKQRSNQADADYLPQVDLYGSAGATGITNSVGNADGTLITGKITASQLVYDFGKTGGQMDFYSEESNASFATYNQDVSNKINAVKNDYYDLLRKDNLIKVYKENVLLTDQQLKRAERYFTAGIKTKIDVVDAKVRLIEAQIELENGKYDLNLAYVTLDKNIGNLNESVKGHVYIPDLNLSGGIYDTLPQETLTPEELVQYAFTHRQELKSNKHKIKSAQSRVRQESGDYYPGLYVGGDYQYSSVEDAIQSYIPEQQWNANINLKWNLFGGLRTQAKTEQAKLTLLQEHASFDDAKLRIRQQTSNALIKLRKTDSNVKLSEELVEAAKEKFDQAQQRYEHGLSDYIELQEARQGYINANADLVSNYYEYYISLAALDRAIGR
ncbi:MAG: TolC family protein [Campylobacterota bacterium]